MAVVLRRNLLTPILLTWRIWWAPNNASRWQMGFNSAFKGLISASSWLVHLNLNYAYIFFYITRLIYIYIYIFFTMVQQPPSGPRPPHCRGFTITLRHTTLGRTPQDEWSARRRDLYLKTRIYKRQISMPPTGFKPTITANKRPQTHSLDRAATDIGYI